MLRPLLTATGPSTDNSSGGAVLGDAPLRIHRRTIAGALPIALARPNRSPQQQLRWTPRGTPSAAARSAMLERHVEHRTDARLPLGDAPS